MPRQRITTFICGLLLAGGAAATTIFNEDFQDGDANGWTLSGTGDGYVSRYGSNYSLRLGYTRAGTIAVSTAGYSGVSVSMQMAASSLENSDHCLGEVSVDGGSSWTTVVNVSNGQDNGVTLYSGSASPSGIDNNSNVMLRFRAAGDQTNDLCWGDNAVVTGTVISAAAPEISVSGNGAFNNVATGSSADRVITVNNTGTAALNIGTVAITGSAFSTVGDTCSSQAVAAAGSCTLTLRFAPSTSGSYTGSLSIPSDDSDEAMSVLALSGKGFAVVTNYDPLSGSGNVSRSSLTYSTLMTGTDPGTRVDLSAYALPADAAQPTATFEGTLSLPGVASGGSFYEIRDDYSYTGAADNPRKHLPPFSFSFVQTGTHIVPTQRGMIASTHPYWEYVLEPGRVWQENSDGGYTRAAIPFSLVQKNANCVHNGVMTFLFDAAGNVSKVAYQISSETCLYFKFDMWGLLNATYTPSTVANATGIAAGYQLEVADRMPTKPIAALATDYGADYTQFGSSTETDPNHMTLFGFVIDGVNYVGGCGTRYGTYPYCDVLDLPSYSTAKSMFAGVALMRLEQKYPGVKSAVIANYVSDCNLSKWSDVTFENALDMATGNYGSSGYMVDESATHTNGLFLATDHASKINYSCTYYSRKVNPGTTWVYHTSDSYILGTAMNAYLKGAEGSGKDIFSDLLVGDIWSALPVSPTAEVTRRTYDTTAQPFTGWGLILQRSDVARIASFLNVDGGAINGQMVLDQTLFDAAMQRDANDRGLVSYDSTYRYNNGFWAHNVKSFVGCSNDTWVPFMSGAGGQTVLLLPNGTTYYYFSDNDTYVWAKAAIESNNIRGYCQ